MESLPSVDLPCCILCSATFLHVEGAILLPCAHYLACEPCFRKGNSGPGAIKCPLCPVVYQNLGRDQYVKQLQDWMKDVLSKRRDQEEIQQASTTLRGRLMAYIQEKQGERPANKQLPVEKQTEIDLGRLNVKRLDAVVDSEAWDCEVCGESNTCGFRCAACHRVDFQVYGKMHEELRDQSEQLDAELDQPTESIQPVNAIVSPRSRREQPALAPEVEEPVSGPVDSSSVISHSRKEPTGPPQGEERKADRNPASGRNPGDPPKWNRPNLPPIQTEFLTLPFNQKPVLVNQEPEPLPAVSKPPVSRQPLEVSNSENPDILAPISELSPEEENKSSVSGLSKSQSKSASQAVVVGQTSVNASDPSTGRRQPKPIPRKKASGARCCSLL